MSSYVYMKVLESAPERYDRGIHRLSDGNIETIYELIASEVATPKARVLDVGTGTGGVALACAARGANVVGIDSNPGMLEIARRKAEAGALDGHCEWLELGAMEIEDRFEKASLDAVVACLVFSELQPEERDYVLGMAYSRLEVGGRIVIADEVRPRSPMQRVWRAARRAPAQLWTYFLTQTTTRPVESLSQSLRDTGFAQVTEKRLGDDDFAIVSGIRTEAAS